jgi:hypothetical protein
MAMIRRKRQIKMNLAFVHIMKTAGTFVNGYLASQVMCGSKAKIHNSWRHFNRDWNTQELDDIRRSAKSSNYVHNHSANWTADLIRRYQDSGWFTLAFYRHPGDQLCSFYHWVKREQDNALVDDLCVRNNTLDRFLLKYWSGDPTFERLRKGINLPAFWQELDYVAVYSDASFAEFLNKFLGHQYTSTERENQSGNRGYDHYLGVGEISPRTHELLIESTPYREYQSLMVCPHEGPRCHSFEKARDDDDLRRPQEQSCDQQNVA